VPNVLKIKREEWGTFVDVKSNISSLLSREIKSKGDGVVGISTITDPYQPIERRLKITRSCLEQLLKQDIPVCIQSKSSLVIRDIELLSRFSDAEVMMSIATLKEEERKIVEPYSSPIKERLNVLRECSNSGIKATVFFGPIYPTIKIQEIPKIIDTFIEYGASKIWIDSLNLKPGILENLKRVVKRDMLCAFSENNLRSYYKPLRAEILRIAKRKIEVVDAFPSRF
jgi:DNA repair photolyase